MALIAPFTQMARSTNRSTPYMAVTGSQLQNVTAERGLDATGPGGVHVDRLDADKAEARTGDSAASPTGPAAGSGCPRGWRTGCAARSGATAS
jgi:hypothetical protein